MSRSLSVILAGMFACVEAFVLFRPYWLGFVSLSGEASGSTVGLLWNRDVRFFRFEVADTGRLELWLPQLVYLAVLALLIYAVLRAVSGVRPLLRTNLSLVGATFLAAGVAELVSRALAGDPQPDSMSVDERIALRLGEIWVAPAEFALAFVCPSVLAWTQMWFFRRWALRWLERRALPVPPLFVMKEAGDSGIVPSGAATFAGRRTRWDVTSAALIPVVLLAIAGGPVLAHTNERPMTQTSVTFDPELWLPYRPPPLIEQWTGLLYPSLRLRPLGIEETGGWLATLAICLVLLAVLAVLLYFVAGHLRGRRPVQLLMDCWYATLLAATVAALVESVLLQVPAPRNGSAVAEAVRFGTTWGWAVGVAFLAAVLAVKRKSMRYESTEPSVVEGAAAS